MQIPAPQTQRAGSTRTLSKAGDGSTIKRTVLPNGLRVITESVPGARSVAVGFWVGVGSRDEKAAVAGGSHFLEHMLFKATDERSAFEISAAIEGVGGDLNAFTTKECTCYHAKVLADDLPLAVDVLSDMVTHSLIRPEDFDAERTVVLEELAMNEDDPADVAHQSLASRIYGRSPLSKPVLGTSKSLQAMTRGRLWSHYRANYRPETVVVAAAGAVDHADVVRLVKRACGDWQGESNTPVPARCQVAIAPKRITPVSNCVVTSRPTEQAHVVLGMPAVNRVDERRWPLAVLDVALGGGMSSRLFQEVREKRGLAYSVYTFRSGYTDAGIYGVYAGTSPDRVDTTIDVIQDVLTQAADNGLSDDELARAKGQLRGASVMEIEDPASRMGRLGEAELLSGQLLSLDDVMSSVEAVTSEDVAKVAEEFLTGPQTLAVVGPFEPDRKFAEKGRA